MRRLDVAIADDNDQILEILENLVNGEKDLNLVGKENNGEEMYEIIKEKQPDIVLLDIFMPKLDGLSVMERVKEEDGFDKNPNFIVVTAVGQERITKDAFAKGASYYILKPFQNDTVIKRIRHIQKDMEKIHGKGKQIEYIVETKEFDLETIGYEDAEFGKAYVDYENGDTLFFGEKEYDVFVYDAEWTVYYVKGLKYEGSMNYSLY